MKIQYIKNFGKQWCLVEVTTLKNKKKTPTHNLKIGKANNLDQHFTKEISMANKHLIIF